MSNEFQYRFIYKKWRSSMECMNNNAFKIRCKNCVKDRLSLDSSVKLTDSNCTMDNFLWFRRNAHLSGILLPQKCLFVSFYTVPTKISE